MTSDFVVIPPEARELLNKPAQAIFSTLLPDGSPHSVLAGVIVDGDELVAHTAPTMQRVKNLRKDPRINVLVVDPDTPLRYVEVRGVASIRECTGEDVGPLFRAHAEKYGLPPQAGEVPAGIRVMQIRITPTKVGYHEFNPRNMGPKRGQAS